MIFSESMGGLTKLKFFLANRLTRLSTIASDRMKPLTLKGLMRRHCKVAEQHCFVTGSLAECHDGRFRQPKSCKNKRHRLAASEQIVFKRQMQIDGEVPGYNQFS